MNANKTVLLTGVTGQVGSELAKLLQQNGVQTVCLIRRQGEKSAQDRLNEVMEANLEGVIAVEGDVTLPKGGFSDDDIIKWSMRIDKIIHCAAAIEFDEKYAEKVRLVNTEGTRNMLELADILGVTDFHYVSTAYVAGSARVFGENDLEVGQASFNAYERAKIEAEKLVHAWGINGKSFTIHRLPIVIGNSKDGKVQGFHSYYGFAIPFWHLLKTMRQRWDKDQDNCKKDGVFFDEQDRMTIPLFIDCSEKSVLNMVPVDWVVETMFKLLKMPSSNQTYHLVHNNPPKVKWVFEVSLNDLGIDGVVYDSTPKQSALMDRIQNGFDKKINIYRQYIKHGPVFTHDNLVRVLGDNYVSPPDTDEAMLKKMLTYAKSVNFGLW